MGKRTDIKKILIIGSGPIVIGQACEFDYSGTQAAKSLRDEGYEVVLVNSNPATIMTDPEFADRTYIEPITLESVSKVIEKERPCAVLGTMGGQTGLNTSLDLAESGILEKYNCELIGAKVDSILMAEDREKFKDAMDEIGLESAKSRIVRSLREADDLAQEFGFPLILRPSRTLGGSGGGIAYDSRRLKQLVASALEASPNSEVLIEESLLGWKEFELELMRDSKDNVVVVCGIENLDPMGIHTGDSITVAPIQTLTDKEYQRLRDASIKIMQKIGVDTGGSNVQMAVNPEDGRMVIIEMNPRVSRSSALASKATGFPIAKISAKLAVGYTLDEVQNDITRETPACFEPALDYVIVKIPRFTFEKFPVAEAVLGTQMKSVGEAMSFGRTFREALQKALCSLEIGSTGLDRESKYAQLSKNELLEEASKQTPHRLWIVSECLRNKATVEEVYKACAIDPWFLSEMKKIIDQEEIIRGKKISSIDADDLRFIKEEGMSDQRIASLTGETEEDVRAHRYSSDVTPTYSLVDTCAGEFKAYTPYFYGSYEDEVQVNPPEQSEKKKVIILGSGPNRIGQGIEFDYCCVHAALALHEAGLESIMVNCNPETVSTDYDTSDRLYFEPLSLESVLNICKQEKPHGVIVQFGGQTPLKLALDLEKNGVPILGTTPESIDLAEDRERFTDVLQELGLRQTDYALARSRDEALASAEKIGYPLMIRPSFVLGGRAMRIVFEEETLKQYMDESVQVSNDRPVLLDRFLHNAIEVDLDAVSDGNEVMIAGVMEHIERAGVHSGDSSCCLPPHSLPQDLIDEMKDDATKLALKLQVKGLMNIQFAVTPEHEVYVLEVNPRGSRTVPFVSKATGIPWAKIATRVVAGNSLKESYAFYRGAKSSPEQTHNNWSVKACVFPFNKFPGVDTILGPEMKSTGEVMGIGETFGEAFLKSQLGAGTTLPKEGAVFLSVKDSDKEDLLPLARKLNQAGFTLVATSGTTQFLKEHHIPVEVVNKVREGSPHIVDRIGEQQIAMVINTPEGHGTYLDSRSIRLVSTELKVPLYTTMAAAHAAVEAILSLKEENSMTVKPLQELHAA